MSKYKSMIGVARGLVHFSGWLAESLLFFLPRKRNTDMVYSADLGKLGTPDEGGGISGRFKK